MPSIISATTTNGLSTSADNSGSLQLATNNGTTALTIDTSQNIGVGTTTPTGKFEVRSANNTGTDSIIRATSNNGTASTWLTFNGVSVSSGNACVFYNGTTERGRIDSDGNLTTGSQTTFNYNNTSGVGLAGSGNASPYSYFTRVSGFALGVNRVTTSGDLMAFWYNGSGVGNVSTNGSNCTFNSTSDYRLKENIAPMTGALAKVAKLKPVTYNWIRENQAGEGFIAHELQEVVPEAVTGTKDAVDEEGNPVYQAIDQSVLVATLTAAIQELKAELDATKAEVQALKGVA